jgi:RHS repeat-associated protein
MEMPGRKYNPQGYRYGFNGKENDRSGEWGLGLVQDYGARIYSPGLGRWLSTDPLKGKYPDWSPYVGMANNPIFYTDGDGREVRAAIGDAQAQILAALSYAFGVASVGEGGFRFVNGVLQLPTDAAIVANIQAAQPFLYDCMDMLVNSAFIYEHLGESDKITHRYVGATYAVDSKQGLAIGPDSDGFWNRWNKWSFSPPPFEGGFGRIVGTNYDMFFTALGSTLVNQNGINLVSRGGVVFYPLAHATLHEMAHTIAAVAFAETKHPSSNDNTWTSMVNCINNRAGDVKSKYNLDFAIRCTNLVVTPNNLPKETGEGQHERNRDERPAAKDVDFPERPTTCKNPQ